MSVENDFELVRIRRQNDTVVALNDLHDTLRATIGEPSGDATGPGAVSDGGQTPTVGAGGDGVAPSGGIRGADVPPAPGYDPMFDNNGTQTGWYNKDSGHAVAMGVQIGEEQDRTNDEDPAIEQMRRVLEGLRDPITGELPMLPGWREHQLAAGLSNLSDRISPREPTLREIGTQYLGEGWTESDFGGTLEEFGLLDVVPGVDLALAFDDLSNVGEATPTIEKIGAMLAIPLSIIGLGPVGKKVGKGIGKPIQVIMDAFKKDPLGVQIAKMQEAAKAQKVAEAEAPIVSVAQSEEILQTLGSFQKWAGEDMQEYLPDRVLNIDLSRFGTTDDIKAAVTLTQDVVQIPHEVKTWKRTESGGKALADRLGMDVSKLEDRWKALKRLDEEVYAFNVLLANSSAQVAAMSKLYNKDAMTAIQKAEFLAAVQTHVELLRYAEGVNALPGRALNSMKLIKNIREKDMNAISDAMAVFGNEGRIDKLAEALAKSPDDEFFNRTAKRGITSKFWDSTTELWINGILSGVKTLSVNMTGNALFTAWQVPERFVQGTIGAMRAGAAKATGRPVPVDRIYVGESLALLYGYLESIPEALKSAVIAFKTGDPIVGDITRMEMPRFKAISSEHLEVTGLMGRTVDTTGAVARTSTRIMLAQDEFFKAVGRRGALASLAYREGAKVQGSVADKARRMMEIRMDPTANDEILEGIDHFAHYVTFQNEMGPMGKRVQALAHTRLGRFQIPLFRFIVPFIRTPVNIFKAGVLERNPVGAAFSNQVKAELEAGGARADAAMGKIATGTSLAAFAGYQAAQDNITGYGPSDPKQRKAWLSTGRKPYSIRVQTGEDENGDPTYDWYQYQRAEPLSFLIGATADFYEAWKFAGQDDPSRQEEITNNVLPMLVAAFAENTTNKTFLTGASDFFQVMEDPKRYSEQWLNRFAATVVPNIGGDLNTVGIPGFVEGDPYRREITSILDAIKVKIPGLSKDMPPLVNTWGEPLVKDKGWLMGIHAHGLPITVSPESRQPIDHEIYRLGIDGIKNDRGRTEIFREALITPPERDISGVRLDEWQHYRFKVLAGKELKMDIIVPGVGQLKQASQKDALNALVGTDRWATLPPGTQARLINYYHGIYVDAAREQLKAEDQSLAEAIAKNTSEELEVLQGLSLLSGGQ